MNQIKLKLFYLMIILVYTQGMLERTFLFSSFVQLAVDGSILAFILFQFTYNLKVPGSKLLLVLCVVGFIISYMNSESIADAFLYLRYVVFSYLIYNQLFSKALTVRNWKFILKLIIIMISLQGLGALYNIFILGERIEGYVGVMSSLGGTTATVFPLVISNLILIFYLFVPRISKGTLLILVVIVISSFLVGYSSGKRTIYFIIPLCLFIMTLISLPKLLDTGYFKRKVIGLAFLGLLIFPLIIFGMINSKGLNYSLSGNESALEVISNSIDYASEYENSTDQYGQTIGRSNTSDRIIENTLSDANLFFLGAGYGSIKKEETMFKMGYGYGIVGFTRDLVSGGFFLFLITTVLLLRVIAVNKSIKNKFTSTLRSSIIVVFVYTHFFYSSDFTVSLKIMLIVVILLSLINSQVHREVLIEILEKNKILR